MTPNVFAARCIACGHSRLDCAAVIRYKIQASQRWVTQHSAWCAACRRQRRGQYRLDPKHRSR